MSDFEEADFCVESWTLSPKRKRKKVSKKNDQKRKTCSPQKTQASTQKAKKNSKCKEAMLEWKKEERKKEKKKKKKEKKKVKKKNKPAVELNDLNCTQGGSAQATLLQKFGALNQKQHEKLNLDHLSNDSVKEAKRKKHVAFDLLPSFIRVKQPQFASSSPKEAEVVREGESCSQVMLTGQTQNQPQDDCQCASDDINSQDLFITQKIFRESPSSSEISDRASSPPFRQRDESQEMKLCQAKADQCPRDSHQPVQERKAEENEEKEESLELRQWEKMSFQTQVFKANLHKRDKKSVHVRPKVVNPFLDEPFVINPTPDAAPCLQHVNETPLLRPRAANISTQTENFFTTELSFYLDFCQKRRASVHAEDLKALDLSLPQRARKDLSLSAKMSVTGNKPDPDKMLPQGEVNGDGGEGMSASRQAKHVEEKMALCCVESTPSPQSEADFKSADMTTSSEEDHFCRSSMRDLLKVRAVQLRLNKPFFFKTKGDDRLSPRPESPLMKLSQGRDIKRKKHH